MVCVRSLLKWLYNDLIMITGVVRSIVVMLTGALFIFWSESVANVFIRMLGVFFFLPAFMSMVKIYLSKGRANAFSKLFVSAIDVGSMAFGLWLIIAPASFENLVVKFLAVVALLFAVFQVFTIFAARRNFAVSMWALLVPLLLVVVAVLLFTSSFRPLKALSVLFGATTVISGIFDLVISLKLARVSGRSGGDLVVPD